MLKSVSGFSFGSTGYNKAGTTYLGKATYNRFWRNPPDLTFELQYPFPINLLHPVALYQTAPPTYPTQRPLATCDLVHAKTQNHHNPQLISWGLTTLNLVTPTSGLFLTLTKTTLLATSPPLSRALPIDSWEKFDRSLCFG